MTPSPANIAYVMSATGCSENEAIASLIVCDNDPENAIFDVRLLDNDYSLESDEP